MTPLDPQIAAGAYARKQLRSASRLFAWSHRRRFEMGVRLARRFAGRRVLDFGCGDGTFLGLLMRGADAPREAVGAEIAEDLVQDCRTRLGEAPGLHFVHINELTGAEHHAAYDGVVCMEVLEHVVELDDILDRLTALLAPGGTLLVSVPVEIGPPLLVKQAARRVAGWRGIGDYPGTTPYTWSELFRGVFAGDRQHVVRPVHSTPDDRRFHDHKGFNWRALRRKLGHRLRVDATLSSPVNWLPPMLGSQAWVVATKHAARTP